ncbi:hypothetical protein VTL71DRAFT_11394 [Oculimacula yallundae]|uniref:Ubiquitin-like domain-containing protein n=1 Tax=Oculimacula yallundae TaxID=86028 RepID=A0ABR4CRN5_9HELO
MSSIPPHEKLSVSLREPMLSSSGYKTINVSYGGRYSLEISLRRTVRVPDNGSSYSLPPDCGPFPIYSVKDYEDKLPKNMAAKGGLFIPIYERESMWIMFDTWRPFAVKVYAGGVNAVSGESQSEDPAAMSRRRALLAEGKSIQDYVVAGPQEWIDGIATANGTVKQFVATPAGSGYSVESQVTSRDSVAGLQFEIMPAKHVLKQIIVRRLIGKSILLEDFDFDTTVGSLKISIQDKEGIPPDQQCLLFRNKELQDHEKLSAYGIGWESIVHMALNLRGGATAEDYVPATPEQSRPEQLEEESAQKPAEMAIAPGGSIDQTIVRDPVSAEKWDRENTILLNLQLFNASTFEAILGLRAPETPITPDLYKEYGLPFFKLYEEPSGISGSFDGVKSVAQIDKMLGKENNAEDDDTMRFREVDLNTVDDKQPFLPVSEMEGVLAALNIARDI